METPTTIAAFREYLQTLEPEGLSGFVGDPSCCPLARYLRHETGDITLMCRYAIRNADGKIREFEPWELQFITLVDDGRERYSAITAAHALEILEHVDKEVNATIA